MDAFAAQNILRDLKIAYCITDPNLHVVEVSSEALALHDGRSSTIGQTLLDLVPELIGSEEALTEVLTGRAPRFELPWVNRTSDDDRLRYLTLVFLPFRDASGCISGLIHLVQDVTDLGHIEQHLAQQRNELRLLRDELKRQNLQLAAANAELQSLDEMKSAFVSMAAHELRGPLTAIMGYLELLLDNGADSLAAQERDYLDIIWGSAKRLLSLINDLLDLARIEAGRLELTLQPTDFAEVVRTVGAEYAAQIKAKGQRLALHVSGDLPLALCDAQRAAQVVGNLIGNATKYTPGEGCIAVNLARAPEDGFLLVSVQDTGVGIPASEQAEVFDRFFRSSNAKGMGGTGLGLYIARWLVELHGGRIWLESDVERGSTFYVTFPVADVTSGLSARKRRGNIILTGASKGAHHVERF